MRTRSPRPVLAGLVVALALAPAPGAAIAPALLYVLKQIGQQAATSMIKDALLSSLSGSGCKGIALSNALAGFDPRRGAGGLAAMPGMAGMPNGMPAMTPEMTARMSALMSQAGASLPPGTLDPNAMATMTRMQQAMAQPLSPAETLATLDELSELGMLPKAMHAELKECMALVPSATPALGSGLGMLKTVIPQMRQAREQLHAMTPQEQDEVAAAFVQEIKDMPADDRAAVLEHVGNGFFPARVVEGVKSRLAASR
ncbi:MAG TPA: hypothetical protein VF169_12465 [Albitalea sp.]|uniref:hypothetical protein n=1 Tax=Piscinibacter sp. TaxID=1903157 RepID=UPI002ED53770